MFCHWTHILPVYPDQVNGLYSKSASSANYGCCMATPRSQNANGASLLYEKEVNYTSLTTVDADNFTFYIHKGPLFQCV